MIDIYIRSCVFLSSFEVMIILGEIMFCRSHNFRKHGKLKLFLGLFIYLLLPFIWNFLFQERRSFLYDPIFKVNSWFYSGYLVFFVFSIVIILLSFKINFWYALFYGSASYIIQHLRFGMIEIIARIFFNGVRQSIFVNTINLIFTLLLFIFVFKFLSIRVNSRKSTLINNSRLTLFTLTTMAVVNIWNMFIYEHSMVNIGSNFYLIVVSALLLVIQFGMFERGKLLTDNQIIESLLVNINKQRKQSAESIDLINRKSHDLKYQIAAMKLMDDKQRDESINELEKAVVFYDKNFNTGNSTLDTVLNEKSLLCERFDIEFTTMVDGSCLDFLKPVDIYSLLGNGIDNAIEAVNKEARVEDKVITLNICKSKNMINICLINVFNGTIKFIDGLPVTDKKDDSNHGFGIKNIKYIVEKYNGFFRMQHTDGIFKVDILLPVK